MSYAGLYHRVVIFHHAFKRKLSHFFIVGMGEDVASHESIESWFCICYQPYGKCSLDSFLGTSHVDTFIGKLILKRFPAELKGHLKKMQKSCLLALILRRRSAGTSKTIVYPIEVLQTLLPSAGSVHLRIGYI